MAQEQGAPSGSKVSAELQAKYAGFRRPGIKDVWPPELFARINAKEDGLVVVDARTPEERQVSVIPGPVVTPEDFEAAQAAPGAVPPRTVVCYCTAGLRSGNCAVRLRDKQQATGSPAQPIEYANLAGGILAWTQEELPLVELGDRTKETKRVHVWSATLAHTVPPAYQTVWFKPTSPTFVGSVLGVLWAWVNPRAWLAWLRGWLGFLGGGSGAQRK